MPGRHQPALAPEVSQLFPSAPVAAAELWGRGDEATLHPEEALIVSGAIDNRRSEFAAGRQCVGLALDRLGHRRAPLLVGNRRSPLWPDTIVGSISHTEGYAVAVVALKDEPADGTTTTVGIDAEQIGRVLEHLHERLFTAAELHYLAELEPDDRDVAATMMFGARKRSTKRSLR